MGAVPGGAVEGSTGMGAGGKSWDWARPVGQATTMTASADTLTAEEIRAIDFGLPGRQSRDANPSRAGDRHAGLPAAGFLAQEVMAKSVSITGTLSPCKIRWNGVRGAVSVAAKRPGPEAGRARAVGVKSART